MCLLVLVLAALCVGIASSATGATSEASGVIVFDKDTDPGPGFDTIGAIWTIRPDGSGAKELRRPCAYCYTSPRFSPDGTKIAYAGPAGPLGTDAVFVMNSDGTNPKVVCYARYGRCDYPIAWSPDGRRLAVGTDHATRTGEAFGLGVLDLATGRLHPFPKLPLHLIPTDSSLDWSPDGTQLVAADAGNYTLWLMRSDGTRIRRIATGVSDARWSADSKTLLVINSDGSAIYTMPTSGGRRKLIRRVPSGERASSVAWSPDERQIAYAGNGIYVLDVASSRIVQLDARTHTCSKPRPKYSPGYTACAGVDWRR